MAPPTLQQRAIARFMADGAYDRYLRSLRAKIKRQLAETAVAIQHYFPNDVRFTVPRGVNMLWIELPKGVNGKEPYRRAISEGVSIVPGYGFSITNKKQFSLPP